MVIKNKWAVLMIKIYNKFLKTRPFRLGSVWYLAWVFGGTQKPVPKFWTYLEFDTIHFDI